jgi:putative transcriptional regulator
MAVRSRVKILLYQRNRPRIEAGERPLTLHDVAIATGIAYAALRKLANNQSTRIDLQTIDRLCSYFGAGVGEILEHIPDQPR